jgi:hypothetical protein
MYFFLAQIIQIIFFNEPILPHLLRYDPFAVAYHSFMGRRLASAASSTR